MCGFAGFIDPALPGHAPPGDVLRAMAGTIRHRGPDDEGFWEDPDAGVHLGFRRLSIQDLSEAGHQPMVSADGRWVIVFNGEVYNFRALRDELADYPYRGHSDTEVMLAAFDRWGPEEAVRRFRGMFALALWDREERALWLARDRMGIKPLYVARSGGAMAFASELRALLPHPRVERRGSREAAWHYLRTLYVPAPLSILDGVEKLRPGVLVRFDASGGPVGEGREIRYWDLEEVAGRGTRPERAPEEAVDALHGLLRDSVRMRLVADVPVGALLSGGIDSSLVVALMAEQTERPVRTFTIRFDDPRFDEGPVAAEVADRLGTEHTAVEMPTSRVRDLMPELGDILDEPLANPSILPTLLVCQVAREDVVVALSGDGGDELFGGYNRYLRAPGLVERADRLPGPLRRAAAGALRAAGGMPGIEGVGRLLSPAGFGEQHTFASRLERAAGVVGSSTAREAYLELMAVGHPRPPVPGGGPGEAVDRGAFDRHDGSLLARMSLLDQLEYLPDDLLAKVDRASMWASLEARVPILDHEVVAFSWTLPDDQKVRDGVSKWPLRRILRRYLPAEVIDRPKMGFTVPVARWLRGDLSDWMAERLAPSALEARGLFDVAAVRSQVERFGAGRDDLALGLWTLAVLEDWCERRDVTFA